MRGILNLARLHQRVEIRVVPHKQTAPAIVEIADPKESEVPAAITDSLLWAGVAAAIAAWLLVLFSRPRRGDRFRLSWRARAFVITAVSVTTFLITLVWVAA